MSQCDSKIQTTKRDIKNQVAQHGLKSSNSHSNRKDSSRDFQNMPYYHLLRHLRNNFEIFINTIYSRIGNITKVELMAFLRNNKQFLENINIFNSFKDNESELFEPFPQEEEYEPSTFEQKFKGYLESDKTNDPELSSVSDVFFENRENSKSFEMKFTDEFEGLCNFGNPTRFEKNSMFDCNVPNLICEQSENDFLDFCEAESRNYNE